MQCGHGSPSAAAAAAAASSCHNNNMTDLSQQLLLALAQDGCLASHQFATKMGQDHQRIVGTIKSLESLGNVSVCDCAAGKPGCPDGACSSDTCWHHLAATPPGLV